MDRCVNCGLATGRCNTIGKRVLLDQATLSVIREWCAPEPVNNNDYACQACWDLAQGVVLGRRSIDEPRPVGHSTVCLRCGRSLSSQRVTHQLQTNSPRELRIFNVIREWIMPQTVS
ncbi:unnamed protein product [Parnassius apollo]|uniref:(apollo) hypothetical protein n=1 Tax=Parnassius apollo TaxID=110799 RepID=A0A8S3X3R2_PARAO|nr:unnamed protein product [Parnassius apollo]